MRGDVVICWPAATPARTAARRLLAVEHDDGAVEDAQRTLHLDREVDVTGVSMMLIWWLFQKHVTAAEVMVMPRSFSCSIQSVVEAPSCVSPIL